MVFHSFVNTQKNNGKSFPSNTYIDTGNCEINGGNKIVDSFDNYFTSVGFKISAELLHLFHLFILFLIYFRHQRQAIIIHQKP